MLQTQKLKSIAIISGLFKRNIAVFAPIYQKGSDPIQQLFLDKIREYRSKSGGGKHVDLSPELQKELNNDKERIMKQFDMKASDDTSKFPTFQFSDPPLENPGLKQN